METFEIAFENKKVPVQVLRSGSTVLYIVKFSERGPLAINRAIKYEGGYFWTSVPEGRQREAEVIGSLIDEYLLTKKEADVLL